MLKWTGVKKLTILHPKILPVRTNGYLCQNENLHLLFQSQSSPPGRRRLVRSLSVSPGPRIDEPSYQLHH